MNCSFPNLVNLIVGGNLYIGKIIIVTLNTLYKQNNYSDTKYFI